MHLDPQKIILDYCQSHFFYTLRLIFSGFAQTKVRLTPHTMADNKCGVTRQKWIIKKNLKLQRHLRHLKSFQITCQWCTVCISAWRRSYPSIFLCPNTVLYCSKQMFKRQQLCDNSFYLKFLSNFPWISWDSETGSTYISQTEVEINLLAISLRKKDFGRQVSPTHGLLSSSKLSSLEI